MRNKKTYNRLKKRTKYNKTRKYKKRVGGTLCPKNKDKNDIYTLGNHYMSATNEIYESTNNPNILIKKIQKPKLNDEEFDNYNIKNINKELEIAQFCSNIKISPHVYYTTLCIDDDNITGYIVMDKIDGKIIESEKELNKHFNKIYEIFDILLTSGIRYDDYNINNFIVENKTNEVYVIDFGDAHKISLSETIHEPKTVLDRNAIKRFLQGSIEVNKTYRK